MVDAGSGREWIEVENTWRSDKDLDKMVACMRAMFQSAHGEIARVHFVVASPGAKNIGKRLRRKLTHGNDYSFPSQERELDARILAEHITISMLDHERLTLTPVAL
ncbi:hypothetical protein BURPS668_3502 [Burkholderia pseudomallei 668]|nr:hypothetical protein BURPS668_3502 [Burkholderia pseudomallei 668]